MSFWEGLTGFLGSLGGRPRTVVTKTYKRQVKGESGWRTVGSRTTSEQIVEDEDNDIFGGQVRSGVGGKRRKRRRDRYGF